MLPIELLPGARLDFDESFDWYAKRSEEAAVRFAAEIETTLEKISNAPERFSLIDSMHRDCLLQRFPFRVVYRIVSGRLLVVAIAHAKRQPGYWESR